MSNKENNITDNLDILKEFNIKEEIEKLQNEENKTTLSNNIINEDSTINSLKSLNIKEEIKRLQLEEDKKILETNTKEKVEEDEKNLQERTIKRVTKRKHQYIISWMIFATKYMITSALIFAVLLITTNYSAYINIAKSYINSNEMEMTQQRLITSVEASNIKEKYTENAKVKIQKKEQDKLKSEEDDTKLSLNKMKKEQDKKDIIKFNDEINLITAGSNYGWPEVQCFSNNDNFVNPLECFDPGLEPGGIIFYSGDKLDIDNDMILASQKATNLFKVQISDNDVNLERILSGLGRIRDVAQGPDGYVYIITTNTDGKAFPAPDDDKLLRILK